MAFWTNLAPQIKTTELRNVCVQGRLLFQNVLSFPFYFPEHVCDVMAAYEAMLMENFTACSVGFYVCKSEAGSEEKTAERKWKTLRVRQSVCVCVCVCVCLCGVGGWETVFLLWTKNSVSLLQEEGEIIWFLKIC